MVGRGQLRLELSRHGTIRQRRHFFMKGLEAWQVSVRSTNTAIR